MDDYSKFIADKTRLRAAAGVNACIENRELFPFQVSAVEKLCSIGRGAAFLDTGMGKTRVQLEWCRQIDRPTIIFCPLAVAEQTIAEGETMGIEVARAGGGAKFEITNYERMHLIDPSRYSAVVYDESSILKSLNSKTREMAERLLAHTKYRLACSATPAPNDYIELGRQAQVLGVMRSIDMLSRWFVNDANDTQTWRLKKHAQRDFWRWISSWAAVASKPADIGDMDTDLTLPPLTEIESLVDAAPLDDGTLFGEPDLSATGMRRMKRASLDARVERCAELVGGSDPAIIWCEGNDESKMLARIDDAEEITGSMSIDQKEDRLVRFSRGDIRVLVTKPSIAGFGLNWQHCANVVFAGVTYSYERYYQAVRRCWRFGQGRPVASTVCMSGDESLVWNRVRGKSAAHKHMIEEVAKWNLI